MLDRGHTPAVTEERIVCHLGAGLGHSRADSNFHDNNSVEQRCNCLG